MDEFKKISQRDNRTISNFLLDDNKTHIIVEGNVDAMVYNQWFQSDVKGMGCKENVIKNIQCVPEKKLELIRAIVDNDYEKTDDHDIQNNIILYLNAHSLETFLWKCDDGSVLSKIINNIIKVEEMENIEELIRKIYALTYEVVMFIGACRLLSEQEGINIVSLEKSISLDEVMIGKEHNILDRRKFVKLFFYNISDDEADNILEKLGKYYLNKDKWFLMRGHDLSFVFVFYIFKYFALNERYEGKWHVYPQKKKNVIHDFEDLLYKNYSIERIKKEQIYITISEWEKKHLTTN